MLDTGTEIRHRQMLWVRDLGEYYLRREEQLDVQEMPGCRCWFRTLQHQRESKVVNVDQLQHALLYARIRILRRNLLANNEASVDGMVQLIEGRGEEKEEYR